MLNPYLDSNDSNVGDHINFYGKASQITGPKDNNGKYTGFAVAFKSLAVNGQVIGIKIAKGHIDLTNAVVSEGEEIIILATSTDVKVSNPNNLDVHAHATSESNANDMNNPTDQSKKSTGITWDYDNNDEQNEVDDIHHHVDDETAVTGTGPVDGSDEWIFDEVVEEKTEEKVAEEIAKKQENCNHEFVDHVCVKCGFEEHVHTFESYWYADSEAHWHPATCEHTTEKGDEGLHNLDANGICTVCGWYQKAVVLVDGKGFKSLEDGLANANSKNNATMVLLKDCKYVTNGSGLWNVTKSMTIDGNGHTISGWGNRSNNKTTLAINNNGSSNVDVTIKNILITSSGASGRLIETRGKLNSLILDNVVLNATGSGANQPLTIGGSQSSLAKVSILNSTISSGNSGYAVLTFNPVDMCVNSSTITGWCCFYFKGNLSSAGSSKSKVEIKNSSIESFNQFNSHSNDFATFVFADGNIIVDIYDSLLSTTSVGQDSKNDIFDFNLSDSRSLGGSVPSSYEKTTINIYGNSKVKFNGTSEFLVGINTDQTSIQYKNDNKVDVNCYSGYYTYDVGEYLGEGSIISQSTEIPGYNFVITPEE